MTRARLAGRVISHNKAKFISRGDNSGTDQMEKSYWPLASVSPSGQAWYLSVGLGMGEVLTMAAELQAYTSDRPGHIPPRIGLKADCGSRLPATPGCSTRTA